MLKHLFPLVGILFPAILFLNWNKAGGGAQTENIVGIWINDDPNSGNVGKVIVTNPYGNLLQLHAFGKCTPTYCDWGVVNLQTKNVWKYSGTYTWPSGYPSRITHIFLFILKDNLTVTTVEGENYAGQIAEKFHRVSVDDTRN